MFNFSILLDSEKHCSIVDGDKSSPVGGAGRSLTSASDFRLRTISGTIVTEDNDPLGEDSGRHCATVICDEGDYGMFTISFDAPSHQNRESRSLSRDSDHSNADQEGKMMADVAAQEMKTIDVLDVNSVQTSKSPVAQLHIVETDCTNELVRNGTHDKEDDDVKGEESSDECSRSTDFVATPWSTLKSPSSTAIGQRKFGLAEKGSPTRQELSKERSGRGHVQNDGASKPQSAWSRLRKKDCETSDAGSESETGSISSIDYSQCSSRMTRSSARSSGGKGTVAATRTNRTFALRCAKIESDAAKPARSRSVGSDGKLTAKNVTAVVLATTRQDSRSRSGSRARPPSLNETAPNRQTETSRSRHISRINHDSERQLSGDSSTSISSSISSKDSNAIARDATFIRRDGGRFSMRVDRTEMSTIVLSSSAAKLAREKKTLKPRSAGSVVQRSATGSHRPEDSARVSPKPPMSAKSKELTAWERRKQYNPRLAAADAKVRGKREIGGSVSEPDDDNPLMSSRSCHQLLGRTGGGVELNYSIRPDDIASLSNAVAYNLTVLSENTQKDSVTLVSVQFAVFFDFTIYHYLLAYQIVAC